MEGGSSAVLRPSSGLPREIVERGVQREHQLAHVLAAEPDRHADPDAIAWARGHASTRRRAAACACTRMHANAAACSCMQAITRACMRAQARACARVRARMRALA